MLTPQNVGGLRIYSIPIRNDARGIKSQPLVMPGVRLSDGSTHDFIMLSSMATISSLLILKNGKILRKTNLGRPIDGNKSIDFWQFNQHLGVLSTGVIDPDTFTWYGVTWIPAALDTIGSRRPQESEPKLAGINAASRYGRVIEVVNADRSMDAQMMAPKNDPRYGASGDEDT